MTQYLYQKITLPSLLVAEAVPLEKSLRMLKSMLRIRRIEEAIESKYHEDQMKTPIHLVIGQEATSVGVCEALQKKDPLYSSHRTHGNYLAKGGALNAMMAEFFCKASGTCGSRGGSMHLIDRSVGMAGSSAICGGAVPIATGAALDAQLRRQPVVTTVFFGDGAAEEGVIWESLNFAALKKLPILYVCENNFYSVCTPISKRQPAGTDLYRKAEAFGLSSYLVDGTNAEEVYQAARHCVDEVRGGRGPAFIEARFYRWRAHGGAGDDLHLKYREKAEGENWHPLCPIAQLKTNLLQKRALTEETIARWEEEFKSEIERAFQFAIESEPPAATSLLTHVYST